jgi:hypothetical protein
MRSSGRGSLSLNGIVVSSRRENTRRDDPPALFSAGAYLLVATMAAAFVVAQAGAGRAVVAALVSLAACLELGLALLLLLDVRDARQRVRLDDMPILIGIFFLPSLMHLVAKPSQRSEVNMASGVFGIFLAALMLVVAVQVATGEVELRP